MASYEIWLANRGGALIKPLYDFASLNVTLATNGVGFINLSLPGTSYALTEFPHKYRLLIRRNGALLGQAAYFITSKEMRLSEGGEYIIEVTAAHTNHLLADRYTLYPAANADVVATNEAADDLMKRQVGLNLGANSADADRDKAAPLNVVTVASDLTEGPVITKAFARRNLLTVLQEVGQAAREGGTAVFFGLVDTTGTGTAQFITNINQWGIDRSASVTVAPEQSNLIGSTRGQNFNEFASVTYALGQGEQAARAVGTAEDTTATGTSDLLFVERTIQANTLTAGALAGEADSLLRESRVTNSFSGQLQETDTFLYGTHWGLGDRVTASFNGETFVCWINRANISVSGGVEQISAILEAV